MDITYRTEPIMGCLDEFKPIAKSHYAEAEGATNSAPFHMNEDWYRALEDDGRFLFVTVRAAGDLVGYCAVVVQYHPHHMDTLCGMTDFFYVDPRFRGAGVGTDLIEFTIRQLKGLGVRCVYAGGYAGKPSGMLLEKLGFRPLDTEYLKELGEDDA